MKELFSTQAGAYARFRPTYPAELFQYLASLTSGHKCAWDCGTGSGQAAIALAHYYDRVVATDPSAEQLAHAQRHAKVDYRVATAEASGIPSTSVDLIVVAQALHWFDHERFYAEVRRVAKPSGSVFAAWCYSLMEVAPAVDRIVHRYYHEIVGPYWEPERRWVEQGYQSLPFPFDEVAPPPFRMEADWNFDRLMGYLGTWSATQAAIRAESRNPLDALRQELQTAWGSDAAKRVRWPLFLRVGRI